MTPPSARRPADDAERLHEAEGPGDGAERRPVDDVADLAVLDVAEPGVLERLQRAVAVAGDPHLATARRRGRDPSSESCRTNTVGFGSRMPGKRADAVDRVDGEAGACPASRTATSAGPGVGADHDRRHAAVTGRAVELRRGSSPSDASAKLGSQNAARSNVSGSIAITGTSRSAAAERSRRSDRGRPRSSARRAPAGSASSASSRTATSLPTKVWALASQRGVERAAHAWRRSRGRRRRSPTPARGRGSPPGSA